MSLPSVATTRAISEISGRSKKFIHCFFRVTMLSDDAFGGARGRWVAGATPRRPGRAPHGADDGAMKLPRATAPNYNPSFVDPMWPVVTRVFPRKRQRHDGGPYAYAVNKGLVDCATNHAHASSLVQSSRFTDPSRRRRRVTRSSPPAITVRPRCQALWRLSQLGASFLMGHAAADAGLPSLSAMLRSALPGDVLAGTRVCWVASARR